MAKSRAKTNAPPDPVKALADPAPPAGTLISYSRKDVQPATNSGGRKVWIEGPGATQWLVEAGGLLFAAYEKLYGQKTNHIDWVNAYVDPSTKRLLVIPAQAEKNETAEVTKKKSNICINLSSLLRKANLEVESGYREMFPAQLETQTPAGIAVVVDMTVALKRKAASSKARKQNPPDSPASSSNT